MAGRAGRLRGQLASFGGGSRRAQSLSRTERGSVFARARLARGHARGGSTTTLRRLVGPRRLRHQLSDFARHLKLTADSVLAFQRDDRGARARRPCALHTWSEFGRRPRRTARAGPTTSPAGRASLSGRGRGRMIGEFPDLGSSGLDGNGNGSATADFRASNCACSKSGSAPTRGRSSRTRAGSRVRAWSPSERHPRASKLRAHRGAPPAHRAR